MSRLTVNIDNSKTEKVVLEVLQALGLNYQLDPTDATETERPLNKSEQAFYKKLKKSFEEIKLHQQGKIQLKTIEEVLAELS
jgi:hypothetical protein